MTLTLHSDLAYSITTKRVFDSAQLVDKLRECVKGWLDMERVNRRKHRDRGVIPELVRHLLRHHQYSSFEEFYLSTTRGFYSDESATKAVELKDDPKQFFENASIRIKEEVERSEAVLSPQSWNLVREATEKSLWKGRLEWIADSSGQFFLDHVVCINILSLPSFIGIYERKRFWKPLLYVYIIF